MGQRVRGGWFAMKRNEKGQFESTQDELEGIYREVFTAYADRMLNVEDLKKNTREARKTGARYWLRHLQDAELDPFEVEENDVRRYLDDVAREYADTFFGTLFTGVTMFYETMMNHPDFETGYESSPAADISPSNDYNVSNLSEYVKVHKRKGREDIKAISMERVENLYGHTPGSLPETTTRNELMLRLLATTGLRADELSRILVENVNTEERKIKIRSSKLDPVEHSELYIRRVIYPEELDYLMMKWLDYQREQFSSFAAKSEYLFLAPQHGGPLNPSYISRLVKDTAWNAEEQEPLKFDDDGSVAQWLITAHRLRHSAISHWVNDLEIPIAHAAWAAGHAKIDTTMDYTKKDWDAMTKSFNKGFSQ